MAKDSFIIYTKYGEQIDLLSDTQAGILLRALIAYQSGEDLPKMDGMTNIVFSVIRQQMDYDNDKYQEVCEVNKANGQRGGRPAKSLKNKGEKPKKTSGFENEENKPSGFSENRTKAKKPESDNDYESDNNIPPISPQGGEWREKFFSVYCQFKKFANADYPNIDFEKLYEEFGRSTRLRQIFSFQVILDSYPSIIRGDFRDKIDSLEEGREYGAKRERWYTERKNAAIKSAEKILKRFMQDEEFAKIDRRLKEISIEQAKAELKGDRKTLAKLEQEQARLALQRRGIIERNGMTEDDLLPKWHCQKCQDTGFLPNGMACDCYEKEK